MPQGARGGGRGDAGQVAQLQAKLTAMEKRLDDLHSGRAGRGSATGGDGAAEARRGTRQRGGREVPSRPGDWRCSHCNAFPCFARARRCFSCGESRGAAGGMARQRDRSEYLGPVGANGARPMLGGRARPQAARGDHGSGASGGGSPTVRVPGASIAAKAEAERRRNLSGREVGERPAPRDGGDAFQPVRKGAPLRAGMGTSAAAAAGDPHHNPSSAASNATAGSTIVRNSWAALSEEVEDDDDDEEDQMDVDGLRPTHPQANGDADDNDDHGGDECGDGEEVVDEGVAQGDADADETELRRVWQGHVHACRLMERNARDFPARLLAEARALRDSAERQWRAAKQPQPLHKRLRWAEAALREAEGKERAHEQELQEHLSAAAQRTREIEGRIAVDKARTARRRAALQALRFEAAPRALPASERAARMAVAGITSDVGPQLAAIIERLAAPPGEDTEAIRQELQLVAVSVSRVEGVLREGAEADARNGRTAHFDIGESSTDGISGEGGGRAPAEGDGGRESEGNCGRAAAPTTTRWAKQNGQSVWRKDMATCSAAAAEEARKLLQGQNVDPPLIGSITPTGANADPELAAATTNDLAEADRRARLAAQRQTLEVQQRQQETRNEQQRQQDDLQLQQRMQHQQEELQRHQAAMQQAAQARAAEETRQRELLLASMSPQELARAAELHAQQAAIGAQVFGTESASQLADMVQRAERQRTERAEVERLMDTSQEEFLAQQNGNGGACPW